MAPCQAAPRAKRKSKKEREKEREKEIRRGEGATKKRAGSAGIGRGGAFPTYSMLVEIFTDRALDRLKCADLPLLVVVKMDKKKAPVLGLSVMFLYRFAMAAASSTAVIASCDGTP